MGSELCIRDSGSIEPVVCHIIPLQRELFARRLLLAGGELLCDARHLFEAPRVLTWWRQEVLGDPIVSPGRQVHILLVSHGITVENGANEAVDSSEEAIFELFVGSSFGEGGEVVPDHFTPDSLVTACENSLKFRECLEPIPLQLVACVDEVW